MSSNGKSTSEKPKAVESDSSPGPIKPIGTPSVSSGHSIGDPHSKRAKGEASVTSGLTKLSGKPAISSGVFIGEPKSKNPNGKNSYRMKTGVSSRVRGKAVVSSGAKGKAIVSAEVNNGFVTGALALSSMTPSRVFLDTDVQATRDYLTWMNTNLDVANRVDADIVTKTETMTIGELFSYMKQEDAKKEVAGDGPSTFFGSVKRAAGQADAEDPKRARSG
ncbi:hypothetical protein YC2023_010033 [Brassica napus]